MSQRGPRRILVTGASYGIGAAVASAVRDRGDLVFSASRTPPGDDPTGWVQADLGDIDSIPNIVERLSVQAGESFDGVVMNAAIADKSRSQWRVDQVERHLRINALAPFAVWSSLEEQGLVGNPCNVVLMGSFLQNGNVRQPAYAMSKAALWSWMRSYTMSQEADAPVSMNMVWPGRVETPANPRRDLPSGDPNGFYSPERVAEVVLNFVYQSPRGPRGTVIDLGRS